MHIDETVIAENNISHSVAVNDQHLVVYHILKLQGRPKLVWEWTLYNFRAFIEVEFFKKISCMINMH